MDLPWILSSSNAFSAARAAWRGATASSTSKSPECPECGYLGWAPVLEVKETDRSAPRELAHAEHRLPSVA